MTVLIILVIGLFWVAFLGPTILRARERQGRADSVGDFRHRLTQLGRTNGRHVDGRRLTAVPFAPQPPLAPVQPLMAVRRTPPPTKPMTRAQKRRRDVLLSLSGAAVASLLLALVTRAVPFVVLHVLADAALVAYVYLLGRMRQQAQQQRMKIRLVGSAYRVEPPYLLDAPAELGTSASDGPRLVPLRRTASR